MLSLGAPDATYPWRLVQVLMLGWLAFLFGRTLRAGRVPLIERIARVSDPELTPALRHYTRRLTVVWTLYFVVAALLSVGTEMQNGWTSGLACSGAAVLFVGERWLRPCLFPGRSFPNLTRQLRDTWSVWRRGL